MATVPHTSAIAVTPSDSVLISETAALYIGAPGASGSLKVTMAGAGNNVVTFIGLVAGQVLPVAVKQVFNSVTTCTNIVALR